VYLSNCDSFYANKYITNLTQKRTLKYAFITLYNKDQSTLEKGGIALASLHNSSFVFDRWQHRTVGLQDAIPPNNAQLYDTMHHTNCFDYNL